VPGQDLGGTVIEEPSAEIDELPVPETSWRARLLTGISWNLAAAAFTQGSTFAINIVLANLLGRQIFGEYAIIRTTLMTLTAVAPLATGYTAARYAAVFRTTAPDRVGRILGFCTIVSTIAAAAAALSLIVGSSWVATEILRAPRLAIDLALVAGAVFFSVMSAYQTGALAGLESYRGLAVVGLIAGTVSLIVCSLAAWLVGLTGALVGLSVSAGIQWVVLRRCLQTELARQGIVVRYGNLGKERAIVVRVALPAALIGFVSMPAFWLASAVLVRQPGGYEQMALYGAANSFRVIVLLLSTVINNVGMSVLGNQRRMADDVRYRQVFWTNMGLTAGVVLLGAFTVILLGPWLLTIFGRGFGESYPVLVVLMLAMIPEGLAAATHQVMQAEDKIWLSLLVIVVPRDATLAVLSYVLSPTYGALGLAVAQGTAWLLALSMCISLVQRIGLRGHRGALAS
jgi:O-antigen/teichoic acid export membrane protein